MNFSQMMLVGFVSEKVAKWLTPLWILSCGVTLALVVLLVVWGLSLVLGPVFGSRGRRFSQEIPLALWEGVLKPITIAALVLATFSVLGCFLVPTPADKLKSVGRLWSGGERKTTATIEPAARDELNVIVEGSDETIDVDFLKTEIKSLVVRSNQNLRLAATPEGSEDRKVMNVLADDELVWNSGDGRLDPFPDVRTRKLYVVNRGDQPADVTVLYTTAPPFPEMGLIVPTCISVLVFYLLYFAQRTIAPRLSAIALSTYKSEVNQPMFLIIMLIGVFSLLVFVWIPYNTLGEDIKVLKDSGFTMILVLSIIQAVWAATTSVSEEIEGRTALTVLSKPIGRPSFLTGKFLGIGWTVALMYVLLGLLLLVVVTYKPLYDAREQSDTAPSWQILFEGMAATTPGLVLAFMETMVLASLSVAISTRLPMAPNFVICFVVYVLGHLTPLIVQSSAGGFEFVHFFAQLIATVFPNLEHFNIQAAVASGVEVPGEYLLLTLGYSGIYTIIALLLGLTMFEDRDLT